MASFLENALLVVAVGPVVSNGTIAGDSTLPDALEPRKPTALRYIRMLVVVVVKVAFRKVLPKPGAAPVVVSVEAPSRLPELNVQYGVRI